MPNDVARSRGEKYGSGSSYNIRQSKKDEYLKSCFEVPYNDVRGLMLSHNHMMLVLRAFLTKALWNLPANGERGLVYCDAHIYIYYIYRVCLIQAGKISPVSNYRSTGSNSSRRCAHTHGYYICIACRCGGCSRKISHRGIMFHRLVKISLC